MTETAANSDRSSIGTRLRERARSADPFALGMLGLLGFVGTLGDAFDIVVLEVLELFHFFWLFFLWPFASMLVGAVRDALGEESDDAGPRDWLETDGGWRGILVFLLGLPLSILNPLVMRQDAMQLLGSVVAVVRHRGSLPDPESYEQSVSYRLPVDGTWTVVNGSPIKEHSHSWFPATQRYAFDLVVTDEDGRTRPEGTATSIDQYYCYDRPVVAPADGAVVDVSDGDPELSRADGLSHPFKRSIAGNSVTVRHAEGEYSCLVHLVPGSIDVEPGDHVERGEQLGRCGHSGNSSEPHLHVQFQDHPMWEIAAGLPAAFDDVDTETPGTDVAADTGWTAPDVDGQYVHVGQRVTHVGQRPTRAPDEQPFDDEGSTERPRDRSQPAPAGVVTLGGVARGISVGGILTVLSGFLVGSLSTIAVLLAGVAVLGVAVQFARHLLGDGHSTVGAGTAAGGVGAAAVAAAATAWLQPPSGVSSVALGAGLFLTGFLLYVGIWEYNRRRLFAGAPSTAAGPRRR